MTSPLRYLLANWLFMAAIWVLPPAEYPEPEDLAVFEAVHAWMRAKREKLRDA